MTDAMRVPLARETAAGFAAGAPSAPHLEGSLGELTLVDVLQLLELGRRTGVLRLWDGARRAVGAVQLSDGGVCEAFAVAGAHPVHAASDDESAVVDALGALLRVAGGRFAFTPGPVAPDGRPLRLERLLVEAMRRADEWARLADVIPGPDAVAVLAADERSGPVAPTARQWAVLAELDGVRDVATLAAALGRPPLAVAGDLATLVHAGLARVVFQRTSRDRAHPDAAGVPNDAPRSSLA
jgi:hypothetical protein